MQQIGQGIGSPISWRRSRLSSVGKQFHADGHLEMSKSITGEELPSQLQLQTTSRIGLNEISGGKIGKQ